ncbi:YbjN domain-containing protein [Mycolicibacterium sp. 141076]|uniref:T3SS (YopN, CesT) and YbjN peptide-binding chaperone 1 n=1 Tax=Mycolicibacterium sp. 141076 TaxID=3090599 RepID=UPI00299DB14E|nr:YbjN domain-containing protein [Mycolicibacterium sp. 141076]MDX1878955.1 YbjN domain-containing protein [Mycolicibacterium sp. 141076]
MGFLDAIFGSGDDTSVTDLDQWLVDTLKRELNLDEIERDDEGDIPITCGSAVVFVRAIPGGEDEADRIEVFSPLLAEFAMKPEVYEAVNEINRQTPVAKAIVEPDDVQIILQAEIYIFDELSSDQLMATLDLVAERADHYDSLLQKRFGGKTMADDDNDDEFDV